ncbi:methyltransferase domain-containing protein [Ditylenchus destructor]|uniref:Methyltransferase domain-containing protein n=1 Tax=Ditylenchus destructor TaxID=166010 RepID=A0AAD4QWE8_9BILA|nr:methyltransferase domain-containing protein [Ditylenchus destructor]
MDRIVYDRMAEHDSTHWWYVARRDILADFIGREVNPPKGARILEIGCGTGHNLPMLGAFGEVDAIEIDPAAREIASQRLGKEVGSSPLPELTGVADGQYDMIAVLDVVEHIEDDVAALEAMAKRLKPGGTILITVPAHQWMWSAHDVVNHHKRRYSKATLIAALERAGLKWRKLGYFNSLLFSRCGRRATCGQAHRQGRQRRFASRKAAQRNLREDLRARAASGRPRAVAAGLSLIVLAQPNG